MRPDNRITAYENEIKVLKCVGLFAHLRYIEVGRIVWPNSTWRVAQQMAERTVTRLINNDELVQTPNSLGSNSILLTKKGVATLHELDIEATYHGPDSSAVNGEQFRHRSFETRYLVERIAQGHTAFGSYAIAKKWAPINRQQFVKWHEKIPDGLVQVPGIERGHKNSAYRIVDGIEVENSRKSGAELDGILDIAWKIGTFLDKAETVLLDRVVFVCDAAKGHKKRIENALERYMSTHPLNNRALLSSIVLCQCRVSRPFVWHDYDETDCYSLINVAMPTIEDPDVGDD